MPQTAEAVLNTNGLTDNAENSNDVYVGAATRRPLHLGQERHPHSARLLSGRYPLIRDLPEGEVLSMSVPKPAT